MQKTDDNPTGELSKAQLDCIETTRAAIKWDENNPVSLAIADFLADTDAFQLKEKGVHKLQDSFGRNLLHHLAFKGDLFAIISCLASKLFSFHDLDHDYNTPLHYYMMSEKFDVDSLDTLLSTFKGDMFAENKHDVSPLLFLGALPGEGAKKLFIVQHHLMPFGTTLYEIIEKTDNTTAIKAILGFKEGGKLPFQDGQSFERHIATLYYRHHKSQKTPLHMAVTNKNFEAVKILLEVGANPNARDHQGNTPLHLAVQCQDNWILDCLLKNRANRDVKNKKDQTPLQLAVALKLKVAEMKIRWKDRQCEWKYTQQPSLSTDIKWGGLIDAADKYRLAWSKKLLELMINQLDIYLSGSGWISYIYSGYTKHKEPATTIKNELKARLNAIEALITVIAIAKEVDKKTKIVVVADETPEQLAEGKKELRKRINEISKNIDEVEAKPASPETKKEIDALTKKREENTHLDKLSTRHPEYLDGNGLIIEIYELLNRYMRFYIKENFIKRSGLPTGEFMKSIRHMMLKLRQCQKKFGEEELKFMAEDDLDSPVSIKK